MPDLPLGMIVGKKDMFGILLKLPKPIPVFRLALKIYSTNNFLNAVFKNKELQMFEIGSAHL